MQLNTSGKCSETTIEYLIQNKKHYEESRERVIVTSVTFPKYSAHFTSKNSIQTAG